MDRRGPHPLVIAVSMAGLLSSPEKRQPLALGIRATGASPSAVGVDARMVALVRALARQAAREAWTQAQHDGGALSQTGADAAAPDVST